MKYIFILFLIASMLGCSKQKDTKTEKQAILNIMFEQQTSWNNADLLKYMEGYWKSDSLKFIGSKGISYGWDATLEGYRKSYPNAEMMGKLSFSDIQVDIISDSSAFVVGRWYLKRTNDEPSGYYTLLWKKINGKWKIVVDHSS